MQIGRPTPASDVQDLAAAVRAGRELGQRPAVTVLRPDGRHEQGFASLAQWVAKGAHLLEVDHHLGPGDRLALRCPAGWLGASVFLAAAWDGIAVEVGSDHDATVAAVHEDAPHPAGAEVLLLGDAYDGRPVSDSPWASWAEEAQVMPDDPPASHAAADRVALVTASVAWTQSQVLEAARIIDANGPVGVSADAPPQQWIPAVAVRPLITGHATVVLDGVDRDAAAGDRVTDWL